MSTSYKPSCTFCGEGQPASFIAAQSHDQGQTITWVFACKAHVDGWNDGGDWEAPVYHIGEKVT